MKEYYYLFCMLLSFGVSNANLQRVCSSVPLQVGITDPTQGHKPLERGSVVVPSINLEGYTLYFETPCDGYELCLLDENANVVYTTTIPTNATNLVLPSYLSGEYEIQIIQGPLYFWGFIEL